MTGDDHDSYAPTITDAARLLGVEAEELVGGVNLVEAARLLGVAPSTVRQRALAGRIGHRRDGRRWIFSAEDLAEYVDAHHQPAREGASAEATSRARPRAVADAEVWEEAKELGLVKDARERQTEAMPRTRERRVGPNEP